MKCIATNANSSLTKEISSIQQNYKRKQQQIIGIKGNWVTAVMVIKAMIKEVAEAIDSSVQAVVKINKYIFIFLSIKINKYILHDP